MFFNRKPSIAILCGKRQRTLVGFSLLIALLFAAFFPSVNMQIQRTDTHVERNNERPVEFRLPSAPKLSERLQSPRAGEDNYLSVIAHWFSAPLFLSPTRVSLRVGDDIRPAAGQISWPLRC